MGTLLCLGFPQCDRAFSSLLAHSHAAAASGAETGAPRAGSRQPIYADSTRTEGTLVRRGGSDAPMAPAAPR